MPSALNAGLTTASTSPSEVPLRIQSTQRLHSTQTLATSQGLHSRKYLVLPATRIASPGVHTFATIPQGRKLHSAHSTTAARSAQVTANSKSAQATHSAIGAVLSGTGALPEPVGYDAGNAGSCSSNTPSGQVVIQPQPQYVQTYGDDTYYPTGNRMVVSGPVTESAAAAAAASALSASASGAAPAPGSAALAGVLVLELVVQPSAVQLRLLEKHGILA